MKQIGFLILLAMCASAAFAQDEGAVVTRERIQRNKGIFIGGGVSSVLRNNFGDYSTGINFEGGYLVRLNRVFSIGGSISYLSFKYDPNVGNKVNNNTGFPNNFYYDTQAASIDWGRLLTLNGGDLSVVSLALNLKFNFIPVKDDSKISFYGFAKPFIANSRRSEVTGVGVGYVNDPTNGWQVDTNNTYWTTTNDSWTKDDGYPVLASQSKITGGIVLGPGIEINPAKKLSIFLQAGFGYTFPINIVSTKSYGNDYTNDYLNNDFPMKDLGFTSINFSGGISFNLD